MRQISVLFAMILCVPFMARGQSTTLSVPEGFSISVFAQNLPKVRSMSFGEDGNLYASSREGKIYRIDKQGRADMIVMGLSQPLGIAYRGGELFLSGGSTIYRLKNPQAIHTVLSPSDLEVLYDKLPADRWHGGKYMSIIDNHLLLNIGVPCNICKKGNPLFGNIIAFSLDKFPFSSYRFVARGVRNSVGFDQDPISRDIFFSDNGQDDLGEDFPFEEINRIRTWGEHFGFPYFANQRRNVGYKLPTQFRHTPPVFLLPPHSASLGIHFYRGKKFPVPQQNMLFVALHGSWARKKKPKTGYAVFMLTLDKDRKVISSIPFVTGFLMNNKVLGRPVDIKEDTNGDIYISDDMGGKIYRVSYDR